MADVIVMCGSATEPKNFDDATANVPFCAIASGMQNGAINFEVKIPYGANVTQIEAAIKAATIFEYGNLGVIIANNDKVIILGGAILA